MVRIPPAPAPLSRRLHVEERRPEATAKPPENGIRTATEADILFLDSLQKKYRGCLGFLPRPALDFYARHGLVTVAQENGEPAGFLLGKEKLRYEPRIRPIFQAAIAMDAQRRHHGLALVALLCEQAKAAGQLAVQANCAADLEANEFWEAAGFQAINAMTPDTLRGRPIICWRKSIDIQLPDFFWTPPLRAGHRAATPVGRLEPINVVRPAGEDKADRLAKATQREIGQLRRI